MRGIVIIGAGQGGFQAAASLRASGFDAPIVLISEEPGLPYQRPPLSKTYMKDGDADRLLLRPASFFERNHIEIVHDRITRIDRVAQLVTGASGQTHAYDHLILAMGAHNAVPPIKGACDAEVLSLRTLQDAAVLRSRLADTRHAVVVGGGFIGLEFAAMARAAGCAVTAVEAAPRVMARAVSAPMSHAFEARHRAQGIVLHVDCPAAKIAGDHVILADGRKIVGDLVLLAAGVRPNVALAQAAGLDVDNGIRVDAHLRTSDARIFALGDCASFPDPVSGRHIRLESVQAATDHAHTIAANCVGVPKAYDAVPWFWSDQGDDKLQIAGLALESDTAEVIRTEPEKFLVFRFRNGFFCSLESINNPSAHISARQLLRLFPHIAYEKIRAHDFNLKQVLAAEKAMAT